ncbi:relaxase/mobilization nuclease domain-containing protein [Tenacibaculum finnmarkense genomovar finnmarkense]|uniref:relaxase/mobilization nuclease domain-containing protein n=1 Tax=Tenacibaculum finnmarkense TaxID=2781243 RepID=UPI000C3D4DCD|nr:relaxase/mobilization nuclease domain-containing protein [Tenacibaculum finnmarkense]MCG8232256.1 relaxase/mobilization nuclease domain-containing protein [Tenacibaculum finnmarkense genomovar finnmarkense]MCG8239772.1 relaxase/mobilization nuclease domain-containing protein [Tenacibaculum finnmarkense genomovar ulcerans]SOS49409.1 Relaxase/mobilization nuclease domain protein [Tenacibaculum dicentrarchi]
MIAKAKSISHGAKSMDYAMDKNLAEIIDKREIVGDNGKEIKQEFKHFQELNSRCVNNDISFVLSPEPKDGKELTNKQFKEISADFLKGMKLDKHQALVVKHNDKNHAHLHIYVNRIDSNGKAYKDNFISKQSQTIADKIAQERGLTRASVVKEFNKEMHKNLKQQIFEKHKAVLQHKPKDFNEYKDLMKASKVDIKPTINKAGKLQGYRVEFQGVSLKATEVHRSMSLSKMGVNIKQTKAISGNIPKIPTLNPVLKIGVNIAKKVISKGLGY